MVQAMEFLLQQQMEFELMREKVFQFQSDMQQEMNLLQLVELVPQMMKLQKKLQLQGQQLELLHALSNESRRNFSIKSDKNSTTFIFGG